jgi:ubiquinone/menaquinone biosynthesis C-methylase UbiE
MRNMIEPLESPLTREDGAESFLLDSKTRIVAGMIRRRTASSPARVLVVGCGSGIEAATFAAEWGAQVVGIDIEPRFDPKAARLVDLRVGDATDLQFPEGFFDLVYSFHALEHIPAHRKALSEMKRVLAPGGMFFIGTPNRSRAVGYLGSKSASTRQKIAWNLIDWKARLLGKFRNDCGAHAGFTRGELKAMLVDVFGSANDVTHEYYRTLYRSHVSAIDTLEKTNLSRLLFPSIYFAGVRGS